MKTLFFYWGILFFTIFSAEAQVDVEKVNERLIFLDPAYFRKLNSNSEGLDLLYNVSDMYALKGNKDSAFFYLFRPIQLCPPFFDNCKEVYMPDVLGNICYEKLHKTKEWGIFKEKIKTGFFEVVKNVQQPELAYDLLVAKGEDQSVRFYSRYFHDRLQKKSIELGKKHLSFIKKVIENFGYPTVALVGDRAARAAFLLCQHADSDIQFQKKVLTLIKTSNEVPKNEIAYLTDRVMVAEEGKQLFGTQFLSLKEKKLYPIKDSINVDKRRKEMNLNSLSE